MTPSPAGHRTDTPPRISVVLCTHQGERWLESQLQSILDQTLPPDEMVVGDDASRDSTLGILQSFARRAPFPVHVARHEPALGVAENFEVTLSRARGRYLALADQDDIWLPDRIERSVNAVQERERDGSFPVLAHSDLDLMDEGSVDLGRRFMETRGLDADVTDPLRVLLRHNLVTGCTITCNRAALDCARPFPEKLVMHDWWLALVTAAVGEIVKLDSPTVRYRQHHDNVVGASRLISVRGWRRAWPSAAAKRALAAVYQQDLELGRRFGPQLSDDILDFIQAIPWGGRRLRRAATRAGIRPQSTVRRIRFYLESLASGYRRYL